MHLQRLLLLLLLILKLLQSQPPLLLLIPALGLLDLALTCLKVVDQHGFQVLQFQPLEVGLGYLLDIALAGLLLFVHQVLLGMLFEST